MVRVHLSLGRLANRVTLVGHGVIYVLAQQGSDRFVLQYVANERVGQIVLNSAQVDVRQRRLRHSSDRSSHAGQVVGQAGVDGHIVGAGSVAIFHQSQSTVALPLVEGDVIHVRQHLVLEQDANPGGVNLLPLIPIA